jgi:hypothetical protein
MFMTCLKEDVEGYDIEELLKMMGLSPIIIKCVLPSEI